MSGEIIAAHIAAGSITTEKIVSGAITANELAANSINAGHLSSNIIEGEHIAAEVILGSNIRTAESGERSGLSAEEGHYAYGPDDDLSFQAHKGNLFAKGEIVATSLTVTDGATWSGANVGAPGASTVMSSKMAAP